MITSLKSLPQSEIDILKDDIAKAADVLEKGGTILYPTDTVWGIGCDATNPDAVKKVFEIKKRSDNKALITLVPEESWIERYINDVPEIAWQLIEVADKPLTLVLDNARFIAPNLLGTDGSVGIRVCKEIYASSLCRKIKRPIVSTSANISGEPTPATFAQISKDILDAVDYVAMWRRADTRNVEPSSVIKLGPGGLFKILR
ncbi:MAG: threonylcarbamoyl-AMP synthase [Muribaculaceae bacterium]|nr:threonylcarbamoyl-AMP synthase [Muribaculaceae bacterium]